MTDALSDLAFHLEKAAEWRRAKAIHHPPDPRNIEAAQLMETLADGLRAHGREPLAITFSDFWEKARSNDNAFFQLNKGMSAYIGRIGFEHFPSNPDALLTDLLKSDRRAA